jgi:transposase-like protein
VAISALRLKPYKNALLMDVVQKHRTFGTQFPNNSVESLNYQLRKATKNRPSFPAGGAMLKILYLAVRNAGKKWAMPIGNGGGL